METAFITHHRNPRLILIFLGWGMDATPFAGLSKPGYDILAVSDFTGIEAVDAGPFFSGLQAIADDYLEIVTVAWSFGVRAATIFLETYRGRMPLTRTVAVNGTPQHIHDTCGIPAAIFNATLRGLSETSVAKFRRRMFSTAAQFNGFMTHAPTRSFASLLAELQSFAALPPVDGKGLWDIAVVGDSDRIFPPGNQQNAWEGSAAVNIVNEPHLPDLNEILRRFVVDKDLVASRFADAAPTYGDNACRQQADAETLWHLTSRHLGDKMREPLEVLEIGTGNGTLTRLYTPRLRQSRLTLWDIADVPADGLSPEATFRCCDAETAIRECEPMSFDLILSASTLQWFNSPCGFIAQAAEKLKPGGLLAISFYGPGTFSEIAAATGETLCYPSRQSLESAAENAGLAVVESIESTSVEQFPSLTALMRHMRLTGVNALTRNSNTTAAPALRMLRRYPLAPDGTAPLTYRPVHMLLRKS